MEFRFEFEAFGKRDFSARSLQFSDHSVGQSIAFAYVEPAFAAPGTSLEVPLLGHARKATVLAEPLYDPANERMRV